MIPERIAQYVVLSRIGQGGMGEVFLARDERLQRNVAIKRVHPDSLDAQSRRRLLNEARASARLDHPNICPVFEVVEDQSGAFIVMPFVEGETLASRIARGPLDVAQALAIGAQVADALAAAHARGILHRDVKPANVMLDARGQARVMDFGLAKLPDPGGAQDSQLETASRLTAAGATVGTAAYMSPEQARGEPLDARSDLFALGAVLYEMLAGRRPFDGASVADTISNVLTRDPPTLASLRPELADELSRIVAKALRKRRDERYQSAADLLVDLRALLREETAAPAAASTPRTAAVRGRVLLVAAGLAALALAGYAAWRAASGTPRPEAPRITSIAVLPLDNMSADPAQEYFADGMTEALTTALARIESLRVLSRTSTMQYRKAKPRMPEIASALDVDALVEGSVMRDGDRVRITAQLIHGPSDRHLWAESYDGDVHDVLGLQRRVAEAIAREVRATVTPAEAAARTRRMVDPAALDAYLRARQLFYAATSLLGPERGRVLESALEAYHEALRIDPDWAEAWAGIAQAQHWRAGAGGEGDKTIFERSREAARKAIALDDQVAEAHGALAYVSAAYDYDLATAEREFRRAIELDPSSPYRHGFGMLLTALGRHEAKAMFEEAKRRDPLGITLRLNSANERLLARAYPEAVAQAREVLARAPGSPPALQVIAWARLWQGDGPGAAADLERALQQQGGLRGAGLLACAGRKADALARLRSLGDGAKASSSSEAARVYACLGDRERALVALEGAYQVRESWLSFINVQQAFDPIRADPRFQSLLRRVGIPSRDARP